MKRLFAAIKIHPSEDFLARYFALKNSLKGEKINWVDPANIHITLKFFGETPEHHIPGINVALMQAAKGASPFEFSIRDTGVFGSSYRPKVIWFGILPADEITTLTDKILRELEEVGIERDRQNFVPHLTLARIKMLDNKNKFQQVIEKHRAGFMQKEEVNEFHLFESILRPQGPKYSIINTYSLTGV